MLSIRVKDSKTCVLLVDTASQMPMKKRNESLEAFQEALQFADKIGFTRLQKKYPNSSVLTKCVPFIEVDLYGHLIKETIRKTFISLMI